MIREVEYFDKPGPANTQRCLEICKRMIGPDYNDIVIASTTGDVGVQFCRALSGFSGLNLVIVTHSAGFKEKGLQELTTENRKEIESLFTD